MKAFFYLEIIAKPLPPKFSLAPKSSDLATWLNEPRKIDSSNYLSQRDVVKDFQRNFLDEITIFCYYNEGEKTFSNFHCGLKMCNQICFKTRQALRDKSLSFDTLAYPRNSLQDDFGAKDVFRKSTFPVLNNISNCLLISVYAIVRTIFKQIQLVNLLSIIYL